jgi:ABC-2 type transport system ATP-binding protein
MLNRMVARGVTIFLTSHVLEIVERLCSHVAIIHKGCIVAQGSIEELRAGVAARAAAAQGLIAPHEAGQRLTLEQIFLEIVGGREAGQELSWLA